MKEIVERKTRRDYSQVFEQIIKQTGEYCKKYNLKSMVLGLSGGLDSTVCAAILQEVSKRYGIKLIGISLPSSTNSRLERSIASTCGDCFCDEYKEINLQDLYLLTNAKCDNEIGESTCISQGNIKSRLRMIMLYNTAFINNGIVIDTNNLTEHYLGFFTIHGDVGDFKPIGKLWKTEVYKLANYVLSLYSNRLKEFKTNNILIKDNPEEFNRYKLIENVLKAVINIKPTDGNGVTESTNKFWPSSSDLDQIAPGYTYEDVDKALKFFIYNPTFSPDEYTQFVNNEFKGDKDTVDGIFERYKNLRFKRNTQYNGVRL